jgi:hypothetical protein
VKRTFSLSEIEVYWKDYEDAYRLRVLKDGKWELWKLNEKPEGCIRAEKVKLKGYMTFSEYLKEKIDA